MAVRRNARRETCRAAALALVLGAVAARGDDPSAPPASSGRWVVGDLHVHVSPPDAPGHSTFTVASAIEAARKAGLDFVALTPHDADKTFADPRDADARVSGQRLVETLAAQATRPAPNDPSAAPILVVAGWEFTRETPGHLGVDFVDVEKLSGVADDAKAATALKSGGLVVVNHPFFRPVKSDLPIMKMLTGDRGWRPFLGEATDDHAWNAVETWHERSVLVQRLHARRVEKFPDTQMTSDAIRAWDRETLETKRRIVAVGGSDCHGRLPYAVLPMAMMSVRVDSFDVDGLRKGLLAAHVTFGEKGGPAARDFAAESDLPGGRASIGDALRAKSSVRLSWSGKATLVENGESVGEFDGGAVRNIEPPGAFRFWRIEKPGDAYSNMIYANLP